MPSGCNWSNCLYANSTHTQEAIPIIGFEIDETEQNGFESSVHSISLTIGLRMKCQWNIGPISFQVVDSGDCQKCVQWISDLDQKQELKVIPMSVETQNPQRLLQLQVRWHWIWLEWNVPFWKQFVKQTQQLHRICVASHLVIAWWNRLKCDSHRLFGMTRGCNNPAGCWFESLFRLTLVATEYVVSNVSVHIGGQ